MNKSKFVTEVSVIDPDSHGQVELSVYKHENGGMFAIDSSYLDQVIFEESDGLAVIPDPFHNGDNVILND